RRLVDFLVERTTLSRKQIGDIETHSRTSFVEVPMNTADEVYEAFINYKQERKKQSGFKRSNKKS
ncbi:MAG: DbpA RNA binding domain-containing protein, partial [Syntrophomonadaceae bacterium]|nr:DbpA RNA binding domain-containing protein [Syntrophomonadaceae bacterium]